MRKKNGNKQQVTLEHALTYKFLNYLPNTLNRFFMNKLPEKIPVNLGDKRLDKRYKTIIESSLKQPKQSISCKNFPENLSTR